VTKGVQASFRIECGPIGRRKNNTRSANGGVDGAWANNAESDGTSCLIAGTGDNWSARLQTSRRGSGS
jgi:hypothetical protein